MANSLNRVNYSGNDFNTSLDEILARLQAKFGDKYNDFTTSSLGIALLDVIAYAMDNLGFYLDRRASDNYLPTSRTAAAASKLARQLGHKTGSAVAASADVEIAPQSAQSFPVVLPIGYQLNGPNGLIYEVKETTTWNIGETDTRTITCSEGETLTMTFVSDGNPNQVFQILNVPDGKYIVGPGSDGVSQVSVLVDGNQWTESEIMQFESTNQFEIGYNDSPPTLRFGDGVAGNIPSAGANITLTYFASSGANGKASAGTITSAVKPLVISFTTVPLNINNPRSASAGSNPESAAKTKAVAPNLFASRGVNLTREDYESRATAFRDSVYGAVAVAQAIAVRSASDDIYLQGETTAINNLVTTVNTEVSTATTNLSTYIDSIVASNTNIITEHGNITTEIGNITTEVTSLEGDHDDGQVAASIANAEVTSIYSEAQTLLTTINAIATAGSNQLTSGTKTSLIDLLNLIIAQSNDAISKTNNVYTILSTSAVASTQAINSSIALVNTSLTNITTGTTNITTQTGLATLAIDNLDANVSDIETGVQTAISNILAHVNSFLASDCQSNLIEVPILTLDSDGFYAVPSIGLQKSLQKYLDAKKGVTQVVKVVSAEDVLVYTDISARIGVKEGYVESTVKSKVEAVLFTLLKGRKFGTTLFLSDIYSSINDAAIDGLSYINVEITGPLGKLDANGNLAIEDWEVITKGVLTLTTEIETGV